MSTIEISTIRHYDTLGIKCDYSNPFNAEKEAANYLECMEFENILWLSKENEKFPYDYYCERYLAKDRPFEAEKCVIDVTIRRQKSLNGKLVEFFEILGLKCMAMFIIPEHYLVVLKRIGVGESWIRITQREIEDILKDDPFRVKKTV